MEIRPMQSEDLSVGLNMSRMAGWNQTLFDWQAIFQQNSGNNWVATTGNQIIGTAMTIAYDSEIEWVGMVLVHPDHRRKGIGQILMEKIIAQAKCPLGLDASEMGYALYKKLGFSSVGNIYRYVLQNKDRTLNKSTSHHMYEIDHSNLDLMAQFDYDCTAIKRTELLHLMAKQSHGYLWKSEENKVKGYTLGRLGEQSLHIGPLVAIQVDVATALLGKILSIDAGKPVSLDLTSRDQQFKRHLEKLGFRPQRKLIRMVFGDVSNTLQRSSIYGSLDPAMG